MYNKKSKTSAILAIITAGLLIGLMILLLFLKYDVKEDNFFAAFFVVLFSLFGYAIVYVSAIPFVIVALVFGIKMLKQQSRQKLISFNKRLLIATCILLPFLAVGLIGSSELTSQSKLGLFPPIYIIIVALAYFICLITQIVTIIVLKKLPAESAPNAQE